VADLEDVRERLAGIAEELADLALDALREAVEAGESARPDLERRVTRARHQVERAIAALRDPTA
jgi:hypothetical protein